MWRRRTLILWSVRTVRRLAISVLLLGCTISVGATEEYFVSAIDGHDAVPGTKAEQVKHAHGKQWRLVWSDKFESSGFPDPRKWDYETGFVRNNEKQYYTRRRKKNARVEAGNLVIEAHRESHKDADYTSASLITKGKAKWSYGRIEVRAKLPRGRGVWPAIWMLGADISQVGWPECGEIDIMEYVGFEPHTIHANIHTGKYNHLEGTAKGSEIRVDEPFSAFHVYAIEWLRDHIDFYVDDKRYFRFENEGAGNEVWPFDKPHYLILNLAIGGSWGGQHGIDDSIFPQEYRIDYVRVYKPTDSPESSDQ